MLIGVIAKVYLAELIEEARGNMQEEEEYIKPEHLEFAYLKLKNMGKFDFDEKVRSVVYMPLAVDSGSDTVYVYRPFGT